MKAITLILPVYNVERYIIKCLASIEAQTFRNFDLILVDDCGKDRSIPKAADFLSGTDLEYRIVRNPGNLGIAESRNAGLAAATGTFLLFVDPDDWIAPSMLEELYDAAVAHDADIAACGGREIWEKDGRVRHITIPPKGSYSAEAYLGLLFNWKATAYFWLRLFRRKLFEGIRFQKDVIFEDFLLFPFLVEKANKIVQTDRLLYNYIRRSESITLSRPANIPGFMNSMRQMEHHFRNKAGANDLIKYNYTLLYFLLFNIFCYSDAYAKAKRDTENIRAYLSLGKLLRIRSASQPVVWFFLLLVKINAWLGYCLLKKWRSAKQRK